MSEEGVTKNILKYLKKNNWNIYSYDFPQSGTGIMIKKDNEKNNKNKDSIIQDIIDIKNNTCVFFENKDRIVISDFKKISGLIINNEYQNNIDKLLSNFEIKNYYYGIGLPDNIKFDKLNTLLDLTDFIILVDKSNNIEIFYDKYKLFSK